MFSSISDLQENNIKLLLLVRDLSCKLEELDEQQAGSDLMLMEAKLKDLSTKVVDLQNSLEQQNQMMRNVTSQKDRYKELYLKLNEENNSFKNTVQTQNDSKSSERKDNETLELISNNMQTLNKDLERKENELRTLTSNYYKLVATVEQKSTELKSNEKIIEVQKKQIDVLEERGRNYELNSSRLEMSVRYV